MSSSGSVTRPQQTRLRRKVRLAVLYSPAAIAGVAQSVEQLTRNEKVGGSIPLSGTMFYKGFSDFREPFFIVKAH